MGRTAAQQSHREILLNVFCDLPISTNGSWIGSAATNSGSGAKPPRPFSCSRPSGGRTRFEGYRSLGQILADVIEAQVAKRSSPILRGRKSTTLWAPAITD